MEILTIMKELEALGTDRLKKRYLNQGAKEPLFGVASGALKPIAKPIMFNQELADKLYDTGNYDAMYLAGMIADPSKMIPKDFDRWMSKAYFYMISDYIVAVTLAETSFAQELADKYIESGLELTMSAGWSCYEWLLGSRKDKEFDKEKINAMLKNVEENIHEMPNRTRFAMNGFVIAVGVSYIPLHEEAMQVAKNIGEVQIMLGNKLSIVPNAYSLIVAESNKGRIGFKRRNVRC